MEKLNFEQMENVNGGSNFTDCASQVLGGMGTLGGAAAALAWGGPLCWVILGFGAGSLAFGLAGNIDACDHMFG